MKGHFIVFNLISDRQNRVCLDFMCTGHKSFSTTEIGGGFLCLFLEMVVPGLQKRCHQLLRQWMLFQTVFLVRFWNNDRCVRWPGWDRVEEVLLEQCKTNCLPTYPKQTTLAPLALFSKGGNWKKKKKSVKLLSHVELFVIPRTVAHQVSLAMAFFQVRILVWVVIPFSRGSFWLILEAQRQTPTLTKP